MGHYRANPAAVHDLVRETEVHRDVYIDQEVFDLEMEYLFANTWIYVGHDSQVPNAGDYYGTTIGRQPVLMVRHSDGVVRVLYNRCPHKGTRITIDTCGNAGKFSAVHTMPGPSKPTARCISFRCARGTSTPGSSKAMPSVVSLRCATSKTTAASSSPN